MLVLYHSRQFAMPHGTYDLNLGSEILILAGDIRSRIWPNIGGTYGTNVFDLFCPRKYKKTTLRSRLVQKK